MKKNNKKFSHGFIGIGRMAEVLLRGLLKSGRIKPNQILVSRRNPSALKKLARQLKVHTTSQNGQVAHQSKWLWLGTKPFQAPDILKEIRPHLRKRPLVLSMMAGVSTGLIRGLLGGKARVVRFMPNTPAFLGEGMTGVYFSPGISAQEKKQVLAVLKATGETAVFSKESDLDAVTGLSGSGPAFVFYCLAGMEQGGRRAGLKPALARRLALQTLKGAAMLLVHTGKDPAELLAQVVSKGGTTEAGLNVLAKGGVDKSLAEAIVRAAKRSRQIRREMDQCIR